MDLIPTCYITVFEVMLLELPCNEAEPYRTSLTKVQPLLEKIRGDGNNQVQYLQEYYYTSYFNHPSHDGCVGVIS
jgi:hypothetical protein